MAEAREMSPPSQSSVLHFKRFRNISVCAAESWDYVTEDFSVTVAAGCVYR